MVGRWVERIGRALVPFTSGRGDGYRADAYWARTQYDGEPALSVGGVSLTMNRVRKIALLAAPMVCACTAPTPPEPSAPPANTRAAEAPPTLARASWQSMLGQTVTLEGVAQNAKLGPLLLGPPADIWIDGMDAWKTGVVGKRVQVTGRVIEKADLPVFEHEEGALEKAGMPVPKGTDLQKASRRFLLTDVQWKLLE
jgi:hypothetical protein